VALVSSGGWCEFAVVNGNAARQVGASRGTSVQMLSASSPT